ncbi:hypothetical protein SNE40_010387 [Patella caerulea]|uniref:Uncharacterized protein n=1 Tax=Patella caerulea TaxID=87958 RepID=A0AAN8JQD1_PATCE
MSVEEGLRSEAPGWRPGIRIEQFAIGATNDQVRLMAAIPKSQAQEITELASLLKPFVGSAYQRPGLSL